jgi:four helix bundle protein
MPSPFPHESLDVYVKAIRFCAVVDQVLSECPSRYAVRDQLERASESIVYNITAGVEADSSALKSTYADYAGGSVLECAACLDIAGIKGLMDSTAVAHRKRELAEIMRMMIGLKKSWVNAVREDQDAEYASEKDEPLFAHEKLDVYQRSLELAGWLQELDCRTPLPGRHFRRMDALTTTIVLNIAEGNGRFPALDHARFLKTSRGAAMRMVTAIDLLTATGRLSADSAAMGKSLLREIAAMLSRLRDYWIGEE